MARSIIPQTMNGVRTPIDDTLPLTCAIESSQLIEGHGEYTIRVGRVSNDSSGSWLVTKRFREFDDLNNMLKEYGFDIEFPKKKLLGRTDRIFMAERQKGLQVYLDALVQQLELCNSLAIQRFLDPDNHMMNYSELALQYVSMFIRSTNNIYQIVEQLPDFGWRYNKSYFLATKTGAPKDERYLLSWCYYGLDKAFGEKDIANCLKLLKSIAHPLIVPIDEIYANEIGTLTVYRFYSKGSLKDYLHQTKPTNGAYWKRYGRKSLSRVCDLNQIKNFGRQILEALNFIYDNGLVYGHLHSGNILFDLDQALPIKLLDITTGIAGVSSKYRCYMSNLKQIRTLEHCDIYGFGRILYELSTGEECPTSACMEFPTTVPIPVQHILLKILTTTGELPTILELLDDPFFQTSISSNIERFQLKLSPKAKEAFEQIARTVQVRLEGDQAKIKNVQRRTKLTNHLMSDEEKLKRRKERQAKALGQNADSNANSQGASKNLQRSISVDPLQLSTQKTTPMRLLTTYASVDIPSISQASSAVAPTPPPPPPPPPPPTSSVASPPPPAAEGDRTQLLNSISDFSLAKLKKAKTNDRSAPKFKGCIADLCSPSRTSCYDGLAIGCLVVGVALAIILTMWLYTGSNITTTTSTTTTATTSTTSSTSTTSTTSTTTSTTSTTTTPPPAVAVSSLAVYCGCAGFTLSLTSIAFSTVNITYQWQSSPTGQYIRSNINSPSSSSSFAVTSQGGSTDYQCLIFVVNPSTMTLISSVVTVVTTTNTSHCQTKSVNCNCCGDDLNTFILIGESGTQIYDINTGCAPNSYDDRTLESVTLYLGTNYTFEASTEYSGSEKLAVWIDFNDNFHFESSEQVASYPTTVIANTTVTMTIPSSISGGVTGNHRMRATIAVGTLLNSCGSSSYYGETHDYTVNILASVG
ncbi:unnamed protein product [Rotaria magnacalcarata]